MQAMQEVHVQVQGLCRGLGLFEHAITHYHALQRTTAMHCRALPVANCQKNTHCPIKAKAGCSKQCRCSLLAARCS
jgi:hypothetical protein